MSNADSKADVARGDHEDVPPRSSSRQTGHFIKWKRAKRHTALLCEAGYLLVGLASFATVTGLLFWLDVPLVAAAFTYLVILVLLSLVSNLSSLIVLSLIGVGCLSYFFAPPIYSFRVDYPQDIITISAFVITSFVVNFLVTRVRLENAMRYMLTGEDWGAEEARRFGLVQDITDPGKQVDRAIELAKRIATGAPLGVKATLASAHRALSEGEKAAFAALQPEFFKLLRSEDRQEFLRATQENRAPVFVGR